MPIVWIFLCAKAHEYLDVRRYYVWYLQKLFHFGKGRVERSPSYRNPVNMILRSDKEDHPSISFHEPQALGIGEGTKDFQMGHVLEYITAGMAAVMQDHVSRVFNS